MKKRPIAARAFSTPRHLSAAFCPSRPTSSPDVRPAGRGSAGSEDVGRSTGSVFAAGNCAASGALDSSCSGSHQLGGSFGWCTNSTLTPRSPNLVRSGRAVSRDQRLPPSVADPETVIGNGVPELLCRVGGRQPPSSNAQHGKSDVARHHRREGEHARPQTATGGSCQPRRPQADAQQKESDHPQEPPAVRGGGGSTCPYERLELSPVMPEVTRTQSMHRCVTHRLRASDVPAAGSRGKNTSIATTSKIASGRVLSSGVRETDAIRAPFDSFTLLR